MPAGCFLEVASLVKEHFKKKNIRSNAGLEIPVVAVGKLGYPDIAEEGAAARPVRHDHAGPARCFQTPTGRRRLTPGA